MAAKFLPYLLAGISVGGQYALIAIGYTMVYGILRLINFAHGDIFTVAGFLMVYATASLPLTISIPLVVVATVLLGIAVEKIAYKPLRTAPRMSVMISAIGMSYLLQNSMWYVTGGLAKQYPALPWISDTVTVLGCQTKRVTVVTPFLVIVLVAALVTLIQKTKIGMAMRAASRDFETAQLMGIKINNVISFTFAVGSFLAAIGSMMYFSNYTAVTPTVGAMPGLKAFVAAVFGGIGSIPGAVIGGFISAGTAMNQFNQWGPGVVDIDGVGPVEIDGNWPENAFPEATIDHVESTLAQLEGEGWTSVAELHIEEGAITGRATAPGTSEVVFFSSQADGSLSISRTAGTVVPAVETVEVSDGVILALKNVEAELMGVPLETTLAWVDDEPFLDVTFVNDSAEIDTVRFDLAGNQE